MMQKGINLSKILKKEHEGKWVALSDDYKKVVGYSESLVKLRAAIPEKIDVVYTKVLRSDVSYAF